MHAERKGLLKKVDRTKRVSLDQAEKEKKMETYGVVQGGVTYQMLSKHGCLVTITLPCHMAPVNNDLIGANEQGPILQGIKGVMYLEYTRPDGLRGPSGRLTTEDFRILTNCSACGLPGMNASWIWERNWLLDSHGIIQDRSAQMELQRTLICESC